MPDEATKFEIDRRQFGAFVAQLRREKGWTQKELAQQLFLSDKAVSKWETGVSLPDTTMLIPLAELLGVTVTELLLCRRMEPARPLDTAQVEDVVKTAITYAEEPPVQRVYQVSRQWGLRYLLALAVGGVGLGLDLYDGVISPSLLTFVLLGAAFGSYFCLFARTTLPRYYDENRISIVVDGLFRMNMVGLAFNNRNWPHILNVGRAWTLAVLVGYPLLSGLLTVLAPAFWRVAEYPLAMVLGLGGLFVPLYVVGKKYE